MAEDINTVRNVIFLDGLLFYRVPGLFLPCAAVHFLYFSGSSINNRDLLANLQIAGNVQLCSPLVLYDCLVPELHHPEETGFL